ncbi:MAG: PKD domain-containing protein, partial [Dehalococcoidia bacterium]|nr:PKD domain-containing protein [Dehalococcoidia bacterium]
RGWSHLSEFQFKTTPSDYAGSDANGDGIGDTPYSIDSDKDNYPLMEPFENYQIGPVNQPPVADASSDQLASSGGLVYFDGSNSHDPDGTIISYEWDFGDGETATGCRVSHRFRGAMNESKNYTVTLTVEDDMGATDTDSVSVTVAPLEKAIGFSHQPGEPYGGGIVTEEMLARMTALYNWVGVNEDGEDLYVVSRIHSQGRGYFGYVLSVWDTYSLFLPIPAWSQAAWGEAEETFTYPFGSYRDWTVTVDGEHFEGLAVGPLDVMQVQAWTIQKGVPPGIPVIPSIEIAHGCFQPSSGQISGSIGELLWAGLFSPGEVRVYDSEGKVTGLINGEVKEEIPHSVYNDGTIIIICSSPGSYKYEVEGTGEGPYGLELISVGEGETTTFTATDIPTASGAVHQYSIDWDALSQGKEGVTVQVDSDGDGEIEYIFTSDDELTQDEFILQTATTIDFDPDTLNLKSKGKWVTVYIEVPLGYEASQIDVSSTKLNGTVPALAKPAQVGDYDSDGVPDLMVKFDRAAVEGILSIGDAVKITITGEVAGIAFGGSDTIKVIDG